MTLLAVFTIEDRQYNYRLAGLSPRTVIKVANTHPKTSAELTLLANSVNATGVITTSLSLLKTLLEATPDYRDAQGSRKLSLDDYAGSILETRPVGPVNGVEVLILNPLEHLVTVSHAPFIFKHYLDKLLQPEKFPRIPKFTWSLLASVQDCKEFLSLMDKAKLCAIDIETLPNDPQRLIDCCSWTLLMEDSTTKTVVLPIKEVWQWDWMKLLNQHPCPKVMQNGLYDATYFCRWNAPVANWIGDTLVLFHAWYSELPRRLDFIASFAISKIRYWKDDGKTGDLMDHYRYNGLDTWATLHSFIYLLANAPTYAKTNYLINFPKVFPALSCALEGIAADLETLERVRVKVDSEAAQELERIRFLLDEPNFNPASPVQVKNLFELLKCGSLPDTAAASMLKARAASPLNEVVLGALVSYKKKKKLISTYYVPEKFWLSRCFYSLNPAATDTNRMASKESAFWCGLQIQNIPRGDAVKQFLKADPGWRLAEVDKAQAEARCVAYLSGEEKLIDLVESEKDYHAWNAAAFFGIPYEEIWDVLKNKAKNKGLRDLSKRVNHGSNFGMGKVVMLETMGPKMVIEAKRMLKLPSDWSLLQVTEHLLDVYAKAYPKVKSDWPLDLLNKIRVTGQLESAIGWTRKFFTRPWENKLDKNAAIAHGPQNLSVSIINEEFYNLWRASTLGSYFEVKNVKSFYQWNNTTEKSKLIPTPILVGNFRQKAQIHDSHFFQSRVEMEEEVLKVVMSMLNYRIPVTDPRGVTREMYIPSDCSSGGIYWSDIK